MAMDAIATDQKAGRRPPPQRPLEIPLSVPWDCVKHNFVELSSNVDNFLKQVKEHGSDNDLGVNLVRNTVCGLSGADKIPFEGFVARTSFRLSYFICTFSVIGLLLFPRTKDQKISLNKFMKDNDLLEQNANVSAMNCDKTRCFLRVNLCAYKGGGFEQGALVCTCHPTLLRNMDEICM